METLPFSSRYKVDEEGYIQFNILHCSELYDADQGSAK